jgi:hypothetical protein
VIDAGHVETLTTEWEAALADANFTADQVRLYPFPGEKSGNENRAYYFTPGQQIFFDPDFPDDLGAQLQDANERINQHRIAVWVDAPTPVLGAKLRHELEHARQWEAHGKPLFNLNDLAMVALAERVGNLPGGGMLYNLNPIETDANAASARFAWDRYGEDECRALCEPSADYGALFRSHLPPPSVETLPKRILNFLQQFPDACERIAECDGRPFTELLDEAWEGAGAAWEAMDAVNLDAPLPAEGE